MKRQRTHRETPVLTIPTSRRAAIRRLGAGGLAAIALGGPGLGDVVAQSVATPGAAATEVGNAPSGHVALEVVAKIDQAGSKFSYVGYLTTVSGLDQATLFTNTNPAARTAAAARFTFVGAATLTARSVAQPLFVVDAQGTLTFYLTETGGANFATGKGFASGLPIAVASLRFQSIIDVLAPKQGLFTGLGELTQVSATPFTLGGRLWQLGHPSLTTRLTTTGQGKLIDPALPRATIVAAGNAVTIGTASGG